MKRFGDLGIALALLFVGTTQVNVQESPAPQEARPLVLTEAIPLEGIKGRFDHFGTSGRKLFISTLGNNTVEVIDVSGRTLEHTITGVPNPQGLVFAPEVNRLFVASSKGKLYIYDGTSFDLLTSIDFHGDVDNLRYDAANKRVYVGFGDEETAAIGAVDATSNKRTDEKYKLGAHPESFQLEPSGPNIYVNLVWSKNSNGLKWRGLGFCTGSLFEWASPTPSVEFHWRKYQSCSGIHQPKSPRNITRRGSKGGKTAWIPSC